MNPFAKVDKAPLSDKHCDREDNKWFPPGLMCEVRGKVHFFAGNSESGSIISKLLASMLKHMDDCQVFDRSDGIRFKLPFLEYINNEACP